MSHEGIRFVSPEEAQAEAAAETKARDLARDARDPRKVRVDRSGGTGVEIEWKDGHVSQWTFAWLRDACPCATCKEARGEDSGHGLKPAPVQLLKLYKEPPRPKEVARVGNYALNFKWNDGHESGIYSWDYLRRSCQCAPCRKQASASAKQ